MALRRILYPGSRFYCTQGVSAVQNATPATEAAPVPLDKLYSKLEVELRGIDPAVLKSYSWFATTAADHLGIEVGNW